MKKFIESRINIAKKITGLIYLNNYESLGNASLLTTLKLCPRTQLQVPFKIGRSIRGLSFDEKIKSDPTARFIGGIVRGENHEYLIDEFHDIYKFQLTCSCADFLNLPKNPVLQSYPLWALSLPWEKISISTRYNHYPRMLREARKAHGLENCGHSVGETMDIVSSRNAVISHLNQTVSIMQSLTQNGIIHTHRPPQIHILKWGKLWRWSMSGDGNHRAYLHYFMGKDRFIVRIHDWVDRDNVSNWFNVKNGTYAPNEALRIFDSLFEGKCCLRGDL